MHGPTADERLISNGRYLAPLQTELPETELDLTPRASLTDPALSICYQTTMRAQFTSYAAIDVTQMPSLEKTAWVKKPATVDMIEREDPRALPSLQLAGSDAPKRRATRSPERSTGIDHSL